MTINELEQTVARMIAERQGSTSLREQVELLLLLGFQSQLAAAKQQLIREIEQQDDEQQ